MKHRINMAILSTVTIMVLVIAGVYTDIEAFLYASLLFLGVAAYYLIVMKIHAAEHIYIPKDQTSSGHMTVNTTNPNAEVYSMVLDEELPYLTGKKMIILDVVHE